MVNYIWFSDTGTISSTSWTRSFNKEFENYEFDKDINEYLENYIVVQ